MQRIGFIGLGGQGGPMATRIAEAGFPLTVWARRPEVLERYPGATHAPTPAALAASVDGVCVCVLADADVEEICLGADGVLQAMQPGTTLILHSTVHPRTVIELAAIGARAGVDVLDVPVSGGGSSAAEGRLCSIAGGRADVLERVRPVLEAHSDHVLHVGDVGAGQRAKLLNNTLFFAHAGLARGLLRLAERLELDPAAFAGVVSHSSGQSWAFDTIARSPRRVPDGASSSSFDTLQRKDLGLIRGLIGESAVGDVLAAAAELGGSAATS
jgi:3-hydroxyisobutyrate dehydrogenase-like beta-hydroxyacid dehydrogenase